jgi:hypothetical protein
MIINFTLLAMTADFTARRYMFTHDDLVFARVGATTSDSAKIQVRYPSLEEGSAVKLIWRETPKSEVSLSMWKDGPIMHLTAENDWVATAELKKLWPSTRYECAWLTSAPPIDLIYRLLL